MRYVVKAFPAGGRHAPTAARVKSLPRISWVTALGSWLRSEVSNRTTAREVVPGGNPLHIRQACSAGLAGADASTW